MKHTFLKFISIVSIFAVFVGVLPASAQDTTATQRAIANPIIITEDEINDSFRVTNPPQRRVTDLTVDLQAGQSVHSFTYTVRAPRGQGTTSYAVVATITPSVNNGRIFWTLNSATVDGAPADQTFINQINGIVTSSWRNYIRSNGRSGRVTSVTITDTEIQIAYQ